MKSAIFLQQLDCQAIIVVDSPAGWRIVRTGRGEPLHLDMFYILSGRLEVSVPHGSATVAKGQCLILPSWLPRVLQIPEPCHHVYVRFNHPALFPHITDWIVSDSANCGAVSFYAQQQLLDRKSLNDEITYRMDLLECLAILFSWDLRQPRTSRPCGATNSWNTCSVRLAGI